jgi:hypothetical protein
LPDECRCVAAVERSIGEHGGVAVGLLCD